MYIAEQDMYPKVVGSEKGFLFSPEEPRGFYR